MVFGAEPQGQKCVQSHGASFRPGWQRPDWMQLALFCVAVLVYLSTLSFGFVYDDRVQILANPFIQSWRYLAHDFTSSVWAQSTKYSAPYYRPVFLSWLRLNYTVFGFHAWGWHLAAVLLHAAASLLVFRLALRLLRVGWQAAVAGLVFAIHPVHVESVAWVSGAADPLMSVFFLSAFLCYLNWRERPSPPYLAAAILLGFLAMFSKEPAITLPAVVFAYALIFTGAPETAETPAGKRFRTALLHAAPFVVGALGYGVLRMMALKAPASVFADYHTILLTAPGLLLFYLRLMVWPVGLGLFYDRQFVQHATFAEFVLPLLGLAALAAALVALLRRIRQRREAAFAAAFALIVLAPALWIRWFRSYDFVHDRYLYLPLFGFAVLFAIALPELQQRLPVASVRWAPALAVGVLSLAMIIGNVTLQTSWANDLLLWYRSYRIAPHNPVVLNDLASELGDRGEFRLAVPMFLELIRLHPTDADAQGNLGYTYYKMGDLPAAEQYLSRAARLDPRDAHWLLYLGITEFKLGSLAAAESDLSRSIALDPKAKGAHLALSLVLEQRGDVAGARREAAAEIANYPGEEQARQQFERLRAQP